MNEDPLLVLLRKHFAKVNKCLENDKNFDILTRCYFKPTSDKAVNSTEFQVNDEYINPEMEFAQRKPGQSFDSTTEPPSNLSFGRDDSEVIQDEINYEENFDTNQEGRPNYSKSSSTSTFKQKILSGEKGDQQHPSGDKIFQKTTVEKPVTPCLEMYKDEEEKVVSSDSKTKVTPQKDIHPSQKFLWSEPKGKMERLFDGSGLDLTPKVEKIAQTLSNATLKETEIEFKNELEQYKKDVKLENAIKNFNSDSTSPSYKEAATKTEPPEIRSDACCCKSKDSFEHQIKGVPKASNSSEIKTKPQNEYLVLENMKIINRPRLLDEILEGTKANVCQRASDVKSSPNFLNATESGHLQGRTIDDDDLFDNFFDKYLKSQILVNAGIVDTPDEKLLSVVSEDNVKPSVAETNFCTRNYIIMNHFEIQKEMSKRIEEMYKSGDGN